MRDRSELTSVDSLTTPVKSYVVAGCRLALSTPSAGTTTLRATRYCEGMALCDPQIRLSGLDLCPPQALFGPKDCRVYPTFHNAEWLNFFQYPWRCHNASSTSMYRTVLMLKRVCVAPYGGYMGLVVIHNNL